MAEFQISDLKGQSILKHPGTIDGESFVLKNLEECSVYLLDYTSEVEVTNCSNCHVFIGPVDGPAIFDNCSGCQVAVACQQFQAKSCSDCEFGLYCATQPTVTSCSNLRFSSWMGAYPKLTEHFLAANLDPKQNNWNKVYDCTADEGDSPAFELVDSVQYWEVPIEGLGLCDNPVPAVNGAYYQPPGGLSSGPAAITQPSGFSMPLDESDFVDSNTFGLEGAALNGNGDLLGVSGGGFQEQQDNPRVAAMREKQRLRLREQEEAELTKKTELRQIASEYLDKFYERRTEIKELRLKENREKDAQTVTKSSEGNTPWERVISLIDFQFTRPNGSDLSRFKNILFTAKTKDIPINS